MNVQSPIHPRPGHETIGEEPVLRDTLVVERLSVSFGAGAARRRVIRDISFTIEPGRAVALVGESGSGKSVTARSLVGLAGTGAHVVADRLSLGERDLQPLGEAQWRRLRGRDIGFVLQDALVSLDPLRPVGREIAEALSAHGWGDRRRRQQRVIELLRQVGVPEPEMRARQLPGELSGGLRQRALIASALALDPGILIADEPTTALDATVQLQILRLLQAIKQQGRALLIISHDLTVVSALADEVLVLRDGEVVEQGPTARVLTAPSHPYTRALLDAVPGTHPKGMRLHGPQRGITVVRATDQPPAAVPLLQVSGIGKRYRGPDRQDRAAVDRVSFSLHAGRTLGIVGESGSGKTTAARIALGLVEPDEGTVAYEGRPWNGPRSGAGRVVETQRRPYRREIGVISQDPLSSFDPRWTVQQILSDALDAGGVPRRDHAERTRELLDKVQLTPDFATRAPLHLSGGQRQRVAIARALAPSPKLIVCDEPVSALDVSVQARILDLLADLQSTLGIAYLFISHDLGVIRHVSDDVLVMKSGRVIEAGPVESVFASPREEFTRQLLAAGYDAGRSSLAG